MTILPHARPDPGIAALLRALLEAFRSGDDAAQRAALAGLSELQAYADETLVGALCLGGAEFAAWLVGQTQGVSDPERCFAVVLDAFIATIEPPADAPSDHEDRVGARLAERFELETTGTALIDTVRAEFLITAGPLEEVPEAALGAIRHLDWPLALRGFVRIQTSMGKDTPRNVYGLAALCLHKLGRYTEAEAWSQRGLGPQQALLNIAPVRSEAELLQRWGPHETPVVSIVCTAYNHERYIESAIRGFLSQDCPYPFEILIHDDASTDGTAQIIREWHARYPRIIRPVLQTQNQMSRGVRPFELLLKQARGEFVATCEGDDFWVLPSKLAQQVTFLRDHPEFSSSAHNHLHYVETTLTVKPWTSNIRDFVQSTRHLAGMSRVLWLPTLVFRKSFSVMPPERSLAAFGDQFLTSYLGTWGPCMFFESMCGAVRRENEFSTWSPLPEARKERMRVTTWSALVRMHQRMGHPQAVIDLSAKIGASPLDDAAKASILTQVFGAQLQTLAAA